MARNSGSSRRVAGPSAVDTTVTLGLSPGAISGLRISNDAGDTTNDINVTAGSAASADSTELLTLSSEITKRIDASWASGDDAGGLSSSLTLTNDTWYAIHLIKVSGAVDVGFDTSVTAANLITDHSATEYRRVGWIRRGTAANLQFFTQDDMVYYDSQITEFNTTWSTGSRSLVSISGCPPNHQALLVVHTVTSGIVDVRILITSPDQPDNTPGDGQVTLRAGDPNLAGNNDRASITGLFPTDSSSQVGERSTNGFTGLINCVGYLDTRNI